MYINYLRMVPILTAKKIVIRKIIIDLQNIYFITQIQFNY